MPKSAESQQLQNINWKVASANNYKTEWEGLCSVFPSRKETNNYKTEWEGGQCEQLQNTKGR